MPATRRSLPWAILAGLAFPPGAEAGNGAAPLALPTGEDPAAWAPAADLAGLEVGPCRRGACVTVRRGEAGWSLEVVDARGEVHRASIPPPRDAASREDVIWLATSLLGPLGVAPAEPRPLGPVTEPRPTPPPAARMPPPPPTASAPPAAAPPPLRAPVRPPAVPEAAAAPPAAPVPVAPAPVVAAPLPIAPVAAPLPIAPVAAAVTPVVAAPVAAAPVAAAPLPLPPAPVAPAPVVAAPVAPPVPVEPPRAVAASPPADPLPARVEPPPAASSGPAAGALLPPPARGTVHLRPWASFSGGALARVATTTTGTFGAQAGLCFGPARVGLGAELATESRYPSLGSTERLRPVDLSLGATLRPGGAVAPLLGMGLGLSIRHYLVDEATTVARTSMPFLSAEAGLGWAPRPWVELSPRARFSFDLGATSLDEGPRSLLPGRLAGGGALVLTFLPGEGPPADDASP